MPQKQKSKSNLELYIRLLKVNDFKEYQHLRLLSLETDPDAFLSELEIEKDRTDNYYQSRLLFSTDQVLFGYYGAFLKNELIGYVQLARNSLPKKSHIAYIYELFVHPKYRNKGVASLLLLKCLSVCKNNKKIEFVILYVNSNNKRSIKLYNKLGFQKIATLPKVVKDKQKNYQDEIIFMYDLKKDV